MYVLIRSWGLAYAENHFCLLDIQCGLLSNVDLRTSDETMNDICMTLMSIPHPLDFIRLDDLATLTDPLEYPLYT